MTFSHAEEIDIICHCVNDCVRETKCDGAFQDYTLLAKSGSENVSEAENEFLKSHKLSSLEFVDWGVSLCGTVYGVVGNEFFRYDFELSNHKVAKSVITKVSSLPTLNQRKAANSEDLCLFKL